MQNNKELLKLYCKFLIYNPKTGIITNKVNRNCARKGDEAGCLRSDGYRIIGINRKGHLSHRVAFLMTNGHLPDILDHINGNGSDNRISNLRGCSNTENNMNRGPNKNSTSKYKGVCWDNRDSHWYASIGLSGNKKNLGYFNTEKEAAIAYNKAAKIHFGEYAYLNEVD